jgi:hypothetical protein
MANLEGELCEDKGNPGLGHQVWQAGVPGPVELESAVQGRNHVRGAVARAVHVVLVQLGRFEAVPDLSQNNFVLIILHMADSSGIYIKVSQKHFSALMCILRNKITIFRSSQCSH